MSSPQSPPSEKIRVLVVGAGLGTNAGLGLEVPLSHGKFLTNGSGGFVDISPQERRERCARGGDGFKGFMGEEFDYLWEKHEGYLGNAGFVYGVLLRDENLHVDMLQHAITEVDKLAVIESSIATARAADAAGMIDPLREEELRRAAKQRIDLESEAMKAHGLSEAYARTIGALLQNFEYHVVFAGSKGICQLLWTVEHLEIARPISVILMNGAEAPAAMDIGLGGMGPDFAEEGSRFVGHPKVRRLVLTSHGCMASAKLRKHVVAASSELRRTRAALQEQLPGQTILVYSALDGRCMANRETHSLPWSLMFPAECWFPGKGKPDRLVDPDGTAAVARRSKVPVPLVELVRWAAATECGAQTVQQIVQFPGPARFGEIRIELAELGCASDNDEAIFQPVCLTSLDVGDMQIEQFAFHPKSRAAPEPLADPSTHPSEFVVSDEQPVFDILFDAQVGEMQVVLKDIRSGLQTAVSEIIESEGQSATRLVRFFRYYDDLSANISSQLDLANNSVNSGEPEHWPAWASSAQWMLEELLAMNKNMGNFLWTGFMTPYTAYTPLKRFGSDLLEYVIELEVARIGGTYRGYSKSQVDTEHTLDGRYTLTSGAIDEFLAVKAKELRSKRRQDFLAEVEFENMAGKVAKFDRSEQQYFDAHAVKIIEGYARREFTIDNNIPLSSVQAQLDKAIAEMGLAAADAYRFTSFGNSTAFRFFADGKAWMSAGCEKQDFAFVRDAVSRAARGTNNGLLACLTKHTETAQGKSSGGVQQQTYWHIPPEIVPPGFLRRNGYRVVAYRKFGDAGKQFNGLTGAWENFSDTRKQANIVEGPSEFWFDGYGPASIKSAVFGQFDKLPAEIGRGATSAKLYFYDVHLKGCSDDHASILQEAIQFNLSSWWEPQLFAITAQDVPDIVARRGAQLEPSACLNFASEVDRMKAMLRVQLEQELAKAKNLWTAGITADGVHRSSRPFPALGSLVPEDPDLEELVGAIVRANIAEKEKHAENGFSMGPTNAKRVLATGNFDFESKNEICQEWLRRAEQLASNSSSSRTAFSKTEAVTFMNRSLRTCQPFVRRQTEKIRKSALSSRRSFLEGLRSTVHGRPFSDELSQRFLGRLSDAIEHYNTFTHLQEEVNVILNTLSSCS